MDLSTKSEGFLSPDFVVPVDLLPQNPGVVRQVHEGQLGHGQAPLRIPQPAQSSPDRSVTFYKFFI